MTTPELTRTILKSETPSISKWAAENSWKVEVNLDELSLEATTVHPNLSGVQVRFHADLSGYPALPPLWRCRNETGDSPREAYPSGGGSIPNGPTGSIFHNQPVICAPWNRLAYVELSGPHQDWIDSSHWKVVAPSYTQAHTIADMLATLQLHLCASPGMQ